MPKEIFGRDFEFLPKAMLLSFEEIVRITRVAVAHGVEKIRLTGGEPLLRVGIEDLVAMLSEIKTPDGRDLDLALTTNGSALAHKAQALKDAGLKRITVSVDSLDNDTFMAMNGVDFPLEKVLHGLAVAHEVGLGPIKINMVVQKGHNDQDIVAMARHFKETPYILRFIEFMDVGSTNGWEMGEVVPSAEVIRRIDAELPLEEVAPNYTGEVSSRWRLQGRRRRDRRDLQRDAVLLFHLHPGAGLLGGQAVHLPVRHGRPRPSGAHAQGLHRRRTGDGDGAHLARAHRQLLRTAGQEHHGNPLDEAGELGEEDRNALHRRVENRSLTRAAVRSPRSRPCGPRPAGR